MFLGGLAASVEWLMRRKLAPSLFEDDDPEEARAKSAMPVETASASDGASAKSKKTADGLPVHSMPMQPANLATPTLDEAVLLAIHVRPPTLQEWAFGLFGIDPSKTVAM